MRTFLLFFVSVMAMAQSTLYEPTNCLPKSDNTVACTINIFATNRTDKAVLSYTGFTFSQDNVFGIGTSSQRAALIEASQLVTRTAASGNRRCSVSGGSLNCYDGSGTATFSAASLTGTVTILDSAGEQNQIDVSSVTVTNASGKTIWQANSNAGSGKLTLSNGSGSGGIDGAGATFVSVNGNTSDTSQFIVYGNLGTTRRAAILQTGAVGTGRLDLCEATGTYCQGFLPSNSITGSQWWTLPTADGTSGQVLSTNGAGALSWVAGSGTNYWSRSGSTLSPVNLGDSIGNIGNVTPNAAGYSIGDSTYRFTNYGVDGLTKYYAGSGAGGFSAAIGTNISSHLRFYDGSSSVAMDLDMSGVPPISGTGYTLNSYSGYFHSQQNATESMVVAEKSGQSADIFNVSNPSLTTKYMKVAAGGNPVGIGYGLSSSTFQIDRSLSTNASQIQFTVGGSSGTTGSWILGTNLNTLQVIYGPSALQYLTISNVNGSLDLPQAGSTMSAYNGTFDTRLAGSTINAAGSGIIRYQVNGTTIVDASRNATFASTSPGALTGTYNLSGNETVTGNYYIRTFSGGNASCGSVADGWFGFRTDTREIQICQGGTTYYWSYTGTH